MSLLRKSLDAITLEDIRALPEAEARETNELEFKGTLPFVPQKGQPQTSDRWIEKGDRVGDYARDEILAELVAFANADGGTLVLGLHETKDDPRRAAHLEALPNCDGLARRLLDSAEDLVEPRLTTVTAKAFPIDDNGSGYVVFRVGKSLTGPHRLKSTREFYIRRGERAAKMDVREIKDSTLELARTGDRIEGIFQQRRHAAHEIFERLVLEPNSGGISPLVIRVSALPMGAQVIPNLTMRPDLWWLGQGFTMNVDGAPYRCDYPAREFYEQPRIRLRSLIVDSVAAEAGGYDRIIRDDGLVEFRLVRKRRNQRMSGSADNRFYIGWLIGLLAGTLAQIHQVRHKMAWDAVEYGLEIEVLSEPPLRFSWNDQGFDDRDQIRDHLPLLLPRYSVVSSSNYDANIQAVLRDLFNSAGRTFEMEAKIPWSSMGVKNN